MGLCRRKSVPKNHNAHRNISHAAEMNRINDAGPFARNGLRWRAIQVSYSPPASVTSGCS